MSANRTRRYLTAAMAWATILLILLVTLFPAPPNQALSSLDCLICGTRGLADAILNTALFAALGGSLALARPRGSLGSIVVQAAALSASVELLQTVVPGRHTSPGDLFFNVVGAAIGAGLLRSRGLWLRPKDRRADLLCFVGGLAVAATFTLTGYMLQPSPPRGDYFAQWTARLAHLEHYQGRLTSARIGDLRLPAGEPLPDPDAFNAAWNRGDTLRIDGIAGPPPGRLAPLLSLYSRRRREVLLVGVEGENVVVRYRLQAADRRLDNPGLVRHEAFAGIAAGDPVAVAVWRAGPAVCLEVQHSEPACDLAFTPADGWAVLYARRPGAELASLISVIWLAMLFFPLGFWARRRFGSALGLAAAVAGLLTAPLFAGVAPLPPLLWTVPLGAAAAGWATRRIVGSRRVPSGRRSQSLSPT